MRLIDKSFQLLIKYKKISDGQFSTLCRVLPSGGSDLNHIVPNRENSRVTENSCIMILSVGYGTMKGWSQ